MHNIHTEWLVIDVNQNKLIARFNTEQDARKWLSDNAPKYRESRALFKAQCDFNDFGCK